MADPEKQAAFVAALRQKAEELAARNPAFSQMRLVSKALVDEVRKRIAQGNGHTSIGAYLTKGTVSLIEPEATDTQRAGDEILTKLRALAVEGRIQACAVCNVIERRIPGGTNYEQFVSVHAEHATGKAVSSQIPADEAVMMRGVPGVSGPAVAVFGGPTSPKIFSSGDSHKPILKIALMRDGRITVDGISATIDSVRISLGSLAEQKGVVWYYREAADRQAPPEANEIMKAVIENRLSVRLSSRPDYSDAILPDGRPA